MLEPASLRRPRLDTRWALLLSVPLVGGCGEDPSLAGGGLFRGIPTFEVGYTYGQLWTLGTPRLHDGLDCIAPETTVVRALEAGTLRQVPDATFGNALALVVESSAVPGEGWLYEHVDPLEALTAEGREVEKGEDIGQVASAPPGAYTHVHLERVSTLGEACDGNTDPYPALRDPLEYPEVRALVVDLEPPMFLPLSGSDCPTAGNAATWLMLLDEYGDEVCPDKARGERLLIVCRVSDRNLAHGKEVAPFNVSLSIDGPGLADAHYAGPKFDQPIFEKCFSGDPAQVVYSLGTPTSRSDFEQRELCLFVNTRLVVQSGRLTGVRDLWCPTEAGEYVLTFRTVDQSGNEGSMEHTLTVGP